jgi:hypothetical protein
MQMRCLVYLLQSDEQPYIPSKDILRDDISPLTDSEVKNIRAKFAKDDEFIIQTITDYKAREAIRRSIDLRKANNSSNSEIPVLSHEVEISNEAFPAVSEENFNGDFIADAQYTHEDIVQIPSAEVRNDWAQVITNNLQINDNSSPPVVNQFKKWNELLTCDFIPGKERELLGICYHLFLKDTDLFHAIRYIIAPNNGVTVTLIILLKHSCRFRILISTAHINGSLIMKIMRILYFYLLMKFD